VRDSRVLLGRGSCTNGPDPLQVRPGFGPVCGFAEFIPVPARYLIKVNKDLPFEQRRLERARWREQLVKLRQSVSSPMRKRLERPPKGDAKTLPKPSLGCAVFAVLVAGQCGDAAVTYWAFNRVVGHRLRSSASNGSSIAHCARSLGSRLPSGGRRQDEKTQTFPTKARRIIGE
jgi:hypothetical protein